MSLTGFVIRNRAAVYLGVVMLTVAGLNAMLHLPAGIYPEATFPRIAIVAHGGTFEPSDMVVAVTRPLEEALSGVIDLRKIRSRTIRGGADLSLDFRPGADMIVALQQVQARVAALQPSLPPGLEIEAERLTPSVFPMMQYKLTGADPLLLRDLAQYTIRPLLARLPDVGSVEVQGGLVREISVELDPSRLVSHGVSVPEVATAIRNSNVVASVGRVDREYRQLSVIVSGLAGTPDAIGQFVVRRSGDHPIRVADLGTVHIGAADRFDIEAGNGVPAALLNVSRQPSGNTLLVETGVRATVDSIRPFLPSGVSLEAVYDLGELVRESIRNVAEAILVGGALAVIILMLFLGRLSLTLIAAASLPLALAGTFLGLSMASDSLNLMSLGGLAVAIGLIIDNAVVVVENIERRIAMHPDEPVAEVVRRATDEIFAPVAGSTLTTVVVFTPLGLLEGVVGQFFRSFSIALSVGVLLSLVLSVTLLPSMIVHWLRRPSASDRPMLSLTRLEVGYERLLRAWLNHPWRAAGAAAILAVSSLVLGRTIGTGFLPDMDEGGFILDFETKTGTSLAESDRELHLLEAILSADPDIQGFTRRVGDQLGLFATMPNRGDMTVLLKPRAERKATVFEVLARLRPLIDAKVPEIRVEFAQILTDLIGDLAGAPKPIEIKLFDPTLAGAMATAPRIAAAIEHVPGLEDLFDGIQGPAPSLHVDLDPLRVARLGLTMDDVLDQTRSSLFGADAGEVREPNRLVGIRARLNDSTRLLPTVTDRIPIIGPAGWAPLSELGAVVEQADPSELARENLVPLVRITADVDLSASNLGDVTKGIRKGIAGIPLPPGVRLEYGGQTATQRESFRQLFVVLLLATSAVLLVMVIQFGRMRGPIAILLANPLGLTGAFAGLALTGIPFNVSSFMGLILLVGLIVKNGIILLDAAYRLRAEGATPSEALVRAGKLRLRPILMTTFCTIGGLFPLALGFGAGAELQRPLAIAVIGGLTLSTLVTLVLLPVGLAAVGALGSD